ncbi:hypothetical protein N7470_007151, partial [Penicillium chermesinum]
APHTLETLPIELLILVLLELPDRASLKAAVTASSSCHRAYVAARQDVLWCILQKQWGNLLDLSEAIIAVRSEGLWYAHHKEEATALLDTWRRSQEVNALILTPTARTNKPRSVEEIIKLFTLHKRLNFFLDDYSLYVPRPEWIEPAHWNELLPLQLSDVEKRRFLRAMCRLQIHANIFGTPERSLDPQAPPPVLNNWAVGSYYTENNVRTHAYCLFFGTMPPWEYHEMGCAWSYLQSKYTQVVTTIADDLTQLVRSELATSDSQLNDRIDLVPLHKILSKDQLPYSGFVQTLEHLENSQAIVSGLTSIGPDLLYRVLHSKGVDQRNLVGIRPEEDALPMIYPADRHAIPNFEHFWSTLPPIERPNAGWRLDSVMPARPETEFEDALWLSLLNKEEWNWGYAFWDEVRLREWDAPLLETPWARQPEPGALLLLPAPYYDTYTEVS